MCEYVLGHTTGALKHLDRLYAINPAYEGLQAVKDAMQTGTYELLRPTAQLWFPPLPATPPGLRWWCAEPHRGQRTA